ncbi:MAG: YkvA family protein [Thermoanaerobaculia bacterium]
MEQNPQLDDDAELDMSELTTTPVSSDRAQRFYDRMRNAIRAYLEKKGNVAGKTGEYLMLVPDVFILMWRLVNDSRVNAKHKVMLGSGLAYYFFPLDIIPEGFLGPLGYVDDLVFGVYLLNALLVDTDAAILREHWSGSDDVLEMIRKVLQAADTLVGSEILGRFKKSMK